MPLESKVAVVPTPTEPVKLEYFKAPFGRRIFALIFDILCMAALSLGFFAGARAIVENSRTYVSAFNTYVEISTASGLYIYNEKTSDNLVTILEYYSDTTTYPYAKQNELDETAYSAYYRNSRFFDQSDSASGIALYNAQKIGDSRIGASSGLSYFVYDSQQNLVANPTYTAETMHAFYQSAFDQAVQYLNNAAGYVEATKTLSTTINFIIIPCSVALSVIIFEFLIPLIFFRRGWKTLGMALLKLGLLDATAVSPRFKTFLIRFLWMFFVEVLLSMVSFGIPLIISFSLWAFRKDGQAFHDYMAGTYMIDCSQQSIYLSKGEHDALLKKAESLEARTDLIFEEDHPKQKGLDSQPKK
jgi:uncharacterized RDD family membrane protein YckC